MALTTAVVNDLLSTSDEDDFNVAIRYIRFLSVSRRQGKAATRWMPFLDVCL